MLGLARHGASGASFGGLSKPPKRVVRTGVHLVRSIFSERVRLIMFTSVQTVASLCIVGLAGNILVNVREADTASAAADNNSLNEDRTALLLVFLLVAASVEACVGAFGLFAALQTLLGSLKTHFWATLVLCFPLAFFAISCFTLTESYEVLIAVEWRNSGLSALRRAFCDEGTSNGACLVPIGGGRLRSEAAWCNDFFTTNVNASGTDSWADGSNSGYCARNRDDAQDQLITEARTWLVYLGAFSLLFVLLKIYALYLIAAIVTRRFLYTHMKYFSVLITTILSIICTYYGWFLLNQVADVQLENAEWTGNSCLILGLYSVAMALLGILGNRFNLPELATMHFYGVIVLAIGYLCVGLGLIFFSIAVTEQYRDSISSEQRLDDIACNVFGEECCCCDLEGIERCKEYDINTVATVLKGDFEWIGVIMITSSVACGISCIENFFVKNRVKEHRQGYI